ncbi:hypothetical protein SSE37_02365 [Sagittula stellata E-37]|uniref:Uncharacterized protein n=1 Tax=Sagittula stellata (strain ATCC 700073 / DSM 11524 / E-37) TaxID=388399 RepID=A3K7S2_SAGS3|nr:hypothetical protein SSE37_02365 [Sagittula stellata E-37]
MTAGLVERPPNVGLISQRCAYASALKTILTPLFFMYKNMLMHIERSRCALSAIGHPMTSSSKEAEVGKRIDVKPSAPMFVVER